MPEPISASGVGGGSNGPRLRLWKTALQQLADETGLIIQVLRGRFGKGKAGRHSDVVHSHCGEGWHRTRKSESPSKDQSGFITFLVSHRLDIFDENIKCR